MTKKSNNEPPDLEADSDEVYSPKNIQLFELIYGKNLISLGGVVAIDNMFSDLNIRNLTALDLGFGLGGVAYYMAEKYQMSVCGVEMHAWMAQYAEENIPSHLRDQLSFKVYDAAGKIPYENETFDMVYSKGVLNHVSDKESLFKKVHKVLKADGIFVIADWIFPEGTEEQSKHLVCETKKSYEAVLKKTGFSNITFRDESEQFLGYVQALLDNLSEKQQLIEQAYGKAIFDMIYADHEALIQKIQQKQKFATRILAHKTP